MEEYIYADIISDKNKSFRILFGDYNCAFKPYGMQGYARADPFW